MSKKHSPSTRKGIPLGRSGGKLSMPMTKEERASIKFGRNEPCPCGSGAKHKKCCLGKKLFFKPEVAKALGIGEKTEEENSEKDN